MILTVSKKNKIDILRSILEHFLVRLNRAWRCDCCVCRVIDVHNGGGVTAKLLYYIIVYCTAHSSHHTEGSKEVDNEKCV